MKNADPVTGAVALDPKEARALLRAVHERAGQSTVVAFDLDSTLLNNAPRQARIMREYGAHTGVQPLTQVAASHWRGWDARIPMRNVGLSEEDIERHAEPFKDYWRDRFFTSQYCVDDLPIAGAAAYVAAIRATGARVCYVTGRHEPMRDGSSSNLAAHGFPIPGSAAVQLIMKPSLDESDDEYKRRAYEILRQLGQVVAAFDNEPAHINGYHLAFPSAQCVHLATDHSMRNIRVTAGIPSVADFSAW